MESFSKTGRRKTQREEQRVRKGTGRDREEEEEGGEGGEKEGMRREEEE